MKSLITLTTDFGTRDWFVGTMKGVILGIHPGAVIVDITHEIAQGDLRAGALALATSYRYFPKGTVHVVVVDPGVGSARKAIAVQTANYFFVAPDNGVVSWALATESIKQIRALQERQYFQRPISRTFHGRDVFAPVAAHLSRGLSMRKLGPAVREMVRLAWPEVTRSADAVRGEILYFDRFGNAFTNIEADMVDELGGEAYQVSFARNRSCALAGYYQAAPKGRAVAVLGSSGLLEIAINEGNAAKRLKLKLGQPVVVRAAPKSTR